MTMKAERCNQCGGELIEIDNRGVSLAAFSATYGGPLTRRAGSGSVQKTSARSIICVVEKGDKGADRSRRPSPSLGLSRFRTHHTPARRALNFHSSKLLARAGYRPDVRDYLAGIARAAEAQGLDR
jgi:hypothetical protein